MICFDCVNGLVREMVGKREVVCCMDGRMMVLGVSRCNMFFRVVDDRPIVESVLSEEIVEEVVKYSPVEVKVEEKRGRGRPRKT